MKKEININMGELAVAQSDTKIKTGSIGSCLVVILYDSKEKIGGMAHSIMASRDNRSKSKSATWSGLNEIMAKYVDESIDGLIEEIEKLGGKKERLEAKLVGGAKMFKLLSGDKFGIGQQNINKAREKFKELGIPIVNEDTGGTIGRIAELNIENGLVDVRTKM